MAQFKISCVKNGKLKFEPGIGTGTVQFLRLNSGITLSVMNCCLEKPVTIDFNPPFYSVGFSFNLAGRFEALPDCRKKVIALKSGQSDMKWGPNLASLTGTIVPGNLMRVGISMDHEVLDKMADRYMHPLPSLLQNPPNGLTHYQSVITPQMRAVVFQILQCPYHGLTREFFIEGKILELLAYEFEQLGGTGSSMKGAPLRADERERMHHAAWLLSGNLDSAPSMEQLAGTVGMCRTRFYECFRMVYGETPLEYLRRQRLENAKNFLLEGRMNVTEAAFAVGYSSSGYFSKDFKRYFGDLPKNYCHKHSLCKNG